MLLSSDYFSNPWYDTDTNSAIAVAVEVSERNMAMDIFQFTDNVALLKPHLKHESLVL